MIRRRMIRRRLPQRFATAVLVLIGAAAIVGLAGCSGGSSALPTLTSATPTPLVTPDARGCPTIAPDPMPAGGTRSVTIETELGVITIKVEADLGPLAAANFVALAGCTFYDGVVFHRVVPGFVIQGGDPTGTGRGGPGYVFSNDPVTVPYTRGVVAMANAGRDTNGSQFFIVLADSGLSPDYSVFGRVTAGMETVDAIAAAADAENPSHPVVMKKVTVSIP
jgi:cyclophilin family peptidyl-prolyl cis-trans isomerase